MIVEPDGAIRPLEPLQVPIPTRAVLTLLNSAEATQSDPIPGSGAAILKFLDEHPLPRKSQRTAEAIQQQIQEERDAWD